MKKALTFFIIVVGLFLLLFITNNIPGLSLGNHGKVAKVTEETNYIEIDVSGAKTTIIPENRDDLQAELDGKGKITVKSDGDKISVEMKRKWFQWLFFNKSELTIHIPENYNQNMEIEIGSGNVTFEGRSKSNPMVLNKLSVDVGSGNVNINNLETKSGSFDISSGNVNLKHFTGKLDANLSSGSFKVKMDKLTSSVDIDVSSGNVKLDLPDNADFTLNGDISSGNISSDFPLNEADRDHIKGKNGSGKYKIDLDVSSGNIDIY